MITNENAKWNYRQQLTLIQKTKEQQLWDFKIVVLGSVYGRSNRLFFGLEIYFQEEFDEECQWKQYIFNGHQLSQTENLMSCYSFSSN
jgi:hypothetical protein